MWKLYERRERYLGSQEIKARAEKKGLLKEATPREMILNYAIQNSDEIQLGDWFYEIGMEPIADSGGRLSMFDVRRSYDGWDDGLKLNGSWTNPNDEWYSDDEFLFAFR